MYMHIYIKMYVCMYVCMYVGMYVCMYSCAYVPRQAAGTGRHRQGQAGRQAGRQQVGRVCGCVDARIVFLFLRLLVGRMVCLFSLLVCSFARLFFV